MAKEVYICEVCNFVYKEKKLAEKCQEWCNKHKSCNLEITKSSIGVLKTIK